MLAVLTSLLVLFADISLASPHKKPSQSDRACQQFKVPVTVTSAAARYNVPRVDSNIDATYWSQLTDRRTKPPTAERIIENTTISDTFLIHVQLCTPTKSDSAKNKILHIATHGIGYDKRYWDSELKPEEYSYVTASLEAGYSILTYDRLGTGLSDKPDAYTVVQGPIQVEILRELTTMARDGRLLTIAKAQDSVHPSIKQLQSPSQIVHVGHSAGSFITHSLLADYGSISDGAILTGYIVNPYLSSLKVGFNGLGFAPAVSPQLFSDRTSGYVVTITVSSIQYMFFGGRPSDKIGGFTEEMLAYADAIKQPSTVGEWSSISALNTGPAPDFKGPLQWNEAEWDAGCGGDCRDVYDLATLKAVMPNARAMEVHIQPNTGHALPFHRNATAGFQSSFNFLSRNGL